MRWIAGLVLLAGCATAPAGTWITTADGGFCYETARGCSAKGPDASAARRVPDGVLDALETISINLQPALDGLKTLK